MTIKNLCILPAMAIARLRSATQPLAKHTKAAEATKVAGSMDQ